MPEVRLSLTVFKGTFAVCRLQKDSPIPGWANRGIFSSITRTPEELSIVCEQVNVPEGVQVERDWKCLQIAGPLLFSLVGILSTLLATLADAGISIFAISTFDTDYLLVKEKDLEAAVYTISQAGHAVSWS